MMAPDEGYLAAPGAGSAYDGVARFYDLTYSDSNDDLGLYQGFAERCGSPILEVGCGTGRVALPLAEAGYRVTGVDLSPAMLAIARQKADTMKLGGRLALVEADARQLSLPERYSLAVIASNSFGLFLTYADQSGVLQSIRKILKPRGLLVFDIFNPDLAMLSSDNGQLFHDFTRTDPATGATVLKMHSRRVDLGEQLIEVMFIYDEMAPDGTVKRTLFPFDTRYFFLPEMELLLKDSGYSLEAVYGSYDLDTYCSESDRMIIVASPAPARSGKV
jgi:ubiquinone/menaquinone biosynthesis C-methylase UbiE